MLTNANLVPAGVAQAAAARSSGVQGLSIRPLPRVAYALALDPSKKFGTMEEQIVLLAEQFQAAESLFAPIFICPADTDCSQFRQRGIDAICLALDRFTWRTLLELRRFIHARRIDLVHWNFMPPVTNLYVWGLSLLAPRVRHWFTDHNSRLFPLKPAPRGLARVLKALVLHRYDRVLGVSEYVRACLAEQQVWPRLTSLLHFVNTERFEPKADERRRVRAEFGVKDRFVLLAVGQLTKEKGMDVAIRALVDLPPRVLLWLVGAGPDEAALRRLIHDLGLEDRAQLLGLQRHVEPFLQAADCFVCPSVWGEAAGLVNIEAQACGTPVIASRIGGIPEYVADGQTGLLFAPGDPQALAHCVCRLLEDPGLQQRFSQAARQHTLESFSPEARLPDWLNLYRNWRDRP